MANVAIVFKSGAILDVEMKAIKASELSEQFQKNWASSEPLFNLKQIHTPYCLIPDQIAGIFIRNHSDH